MDELRRMLAARAERGSERGIDQVVADAIEAFERTGTGAARRTAPVPGGPGRRRRWTLVAVAATAVLLVAAVVWAPWRPDGSDELRVTGVTSTTSASEQSSAWTAMAVGPLAGRYAAATASDGARVLIWGGLDGTRTIPFADGALYDPAADRWDTVPDAPAPLAGPAAEAVWDGSRFLVLAPGDTDTPVALGAYDPAERVWELLASPPLGPRERFHAVWTGSRLVVAGGGAGDSIPSPFGASYDPATDHWQVLPDPPYEHYVPGAAVWDGNAVVFVGGVADAANSTQPQEAVPGAVYRPDADRPLVRPARRTGRSSAVRVLDPRRRGDPRPVVGQPRNRPDCRLLRRSMAIAP